METNPPMKRLVTLATLAVVGLAGLMAAEPARAQESLTFGQFALRSGSGPFPFVFTNTGNVGPGQTVVAMTSPNPVNVRFTFTDTSPETNPVLVDPALSDQVVDATLTFSAVSTQAASVTPQGNVLQAFDSGTIVIRSAINGVRGGTTFAVGDEILRVSFVNSSVTLAGSLGGTATTLQASSTGVGPDDITYSANPKFFNFASQFVENFALAFSGMENGGPGPGLAIGANGAIQSFRTSGTGTFAVAQGIIPEPATLAMAGLGLMGIPALALIRRRRAR